MMKHAQLFVLLACCLTTACNNHGCIDYESTYDHWLPSNMVGKQAYYTDGTDTFMVKGSSITHFGDDHTYDKNRCGCDPYAQMTQSGPEAKIDWRASYSWQKGEKDLQNGDIAVHLRGIMMDKVLREPEFFFFYIQMKSHDACDDPSRRTQCIAEKTVFGESYSDVLMAVHASDTLYYVQHIGFIELKIGNLAWKLIPDRNPN